MEEEKILKKMAEAFKELANILAQCPDGEEARLELGPFSQACSLVSPLFRCLGIAFKFAELDYVAKVNDLTEASESISVVPMMIDDDVKSDCVRTAGSHTRNLLRVKRGLDMVKVLLEHIISSEIQLRELMLKCSLPTMDGPLGKPVGAGMYALPTKAQLLNKLNEDETSARVEMQKYIASATPIIKYIDQLFISRGLGTDW